MADKNVSLTDEEKAVVTKYRKGEITAFDTSEKDIQTMTQLMNKAEALLGELNAYDEIEGDLVEWYCKKCGY